MYRVRGRERSRGEMISVYKVAHFLLSKVVRREA
jgi:hypothetical protein